MALHPSETFSDLRAEAREVDHSVPARVRAMKAKVRAALQSGLIDHTQLLDLLALMPTEKEMAGGDAKQEGGGAAEAQVAGQQKTWWRTVAGLGIW